MGIETKQVAHSRSRRRSYNVGEFSMRKSRIHCNIFNIKSQIYHLISILRSQRIVFNSRNHCHYSCCCPMLQWWSLTTFSFQKIRNPTKLLFLFLNSLSREPCPRGTRGELCYFSSTCFMHFFLEFDLFDYFPIQCFNFLVHTFTLHILELLP